ncbi:hypothetical protein QCA50_007036 [Cerrena zonata]|uniref:MADS-box domain-containing protein n=1 Tax=Cerrena zonata TaxID=2478898 RepID=A0AAW0GJG7_9APHY
MAFRHPLQPPASLENAFPHPPAYSNPAEPIATSLSGVSQMAPPDPASPSVSNKRQRLDNIDPSQQIPGAEDTFIQDHEAGESGADDDEDDEKPKSDKKAGRRKIKIEFIQDKSRRHITFSKRKAGIMKKAYELSTLTGTQVLLLVVSETGLVYTFTTAKLQPLVTQPEGKNLIQACLNAPHGQLPSSMPVGTPIGRSANPMNMGGGPPNVPGGLSISGGSKEEGDDGDGEGEGDSGNERNANSANNTSGGQTGPARKRRRASSSAGTNANNNGNSPTTRSAAAAAAAANQQSSQQAQQQPQLSPTATQQNQGPTSPHARQPMPLPIPQSAPGAPPGVMSPTGSLASPLDHQQHRAPPPPSPQSYHAPYPSGEMYGQPGAPQPGYGPSPGGPPGAPYGYPPHDPQAAAAAAAAAGGQPGMPPPAWGAQPGVPQYGRR